MNREGQIIDHYSLSKLLAEQVCRSYEPFFTVQILRLFLSVRSGTARTADPFAHRLHRTGPSHSTEQSRWATANQSYRYADFCEAIPASVPPWTFRHGQCRRAEALSIREIAELIGKEIGNKPRFEVKSGPKVGICSEARPCSRN